MTEETYGERAVGMDHNPSGLSDVDHVKYGFKKLINHFDTLRTHLDSLREKSSDGEVKEMLTLAIRDCQTAQMWAVKAITWGLK